MPLFYLFFIPVLIKNHLAETDRIHTQRLRRGAVHRAGSGGRQLLRPLVALYGGPAAGPLQPRDRRRAQPLRRRAAAAPPRLLARVAELEERLARYDEAENYARLDSYLQDIGESKYHFATATVVGNSVNVILGGRVGPEHLVPRQRQARRLGLLRLGLLGRGRPPRGGAGRPVQVRRTPARAGGRHGRFLAVLPRRGAHRLGRERRTQRDRHGLHGAGAPCGRNLPRLSDGVLVCNRDQYEIRDLEQSDQVEQHIRLD